LIKRDSLTNDPIKKFKRKKFECPVAKKSDSDDNFPPPNPHFDQSSYYSFGNGGFANGNRVPQQTMANNPPLLHENEISSHLQDINRIVYSSEKLETSKKKQEYEDPDEETNSEVDEFFNKVKTFKGKPREEMKQYSQTSSEEGENSMDEEEDPDDVLDKQMAELAKQLRKADPTKEFIQNPKQGLNF
jgi:hypothetical protein